MAHKFRVEIEIEVPDNTFGPDDGDMFDWEEHIARSLVHRPSRIEEAKTEIIAVNFQMPVTESW